MSPLHLPEVERRAAYVRAAAFAPNGRFLVAGGAETVVWSVGTPDPIALGRFEVIGRGLAISPDGTRLATSQAGPISVRLWSLPDLCEIQAWSLSELGGWDVSCAVAFTPDGGHLVVAGWDGVLRRMVLPKAT